MVIWRGLRILVSKVERRSSELSGGLCVSCRRIRSGGTRPSGSTIGHAGWSRQTLCCAARRYLSKNLCKWVRYVPHLRPRVYLGGSSRLPSNRGQERTHADRRYRSFHRPTNIRLGVATSGAREGARMRERAQSGSGTVSIAR